MSRLEELFAKVRKSPQDMTLEEAMELQKLATRDRATVGQKTARAVKRQAKGMTKMTAEELERKLQELLNQQNNAATLQQEGTTASESDNSPIDKTKDTN